jgi:cytochrome P450
VTTLIADLPELDLHGESFNRTPHEVLQSILARSPLARSRRGIEILDYAWIEDVINDRRFETPEANAFIRKGVPPLFQAFVENGFLLGMSGEQHARIRRALVNAFTPRRMREQVATMQQVAHALVDEMLMRSGGDFMADYSFDFAARMICRVLGVPAEDIPRFAAAGRELSLMGASPIAAGYPRIEAALGILHDYVQSLVAARRDQSRDDFISDLIAGQQSDRAMTDAELVWNIVNLLFAGMDTSRYQLASAVRALITEPGDHWERLARAPDLVPDALKECMRFYPTVRFDARIALEEVDIRGVTFAPGQRLFLSKLAASRDPGRFSEPNRFEIERGAKFDLAFGRGHHFCVGNALARIGMEESLKVLTARLCDIETAGDLVVSRPSSMVGGPEVLPIRYRPRDRG